MTRRITYRLLLLSALFALAFPVTSQTLVSFPSDSAAIVRFTIPTYKPVALEYTAPDTLINYAHTYRPLTRPGEWYAWLGNNGLPQNNLTPDFTSSQGLAYGRNGFAAYIQNPADVAFYQSRRPYSNVSYVSGPDNENQLEALLSKNVYKGITAGVKYRLISSTGPYAYQKADNNNLAVSLRYFSPDGRYGAMAGYLLNTFEIQENGGIANETDFTNNTESNRAVISTRLTSAWSRNGNMRAFVTSFYEPAIRYGVGDSLLADPVPFSLPQTHPTDTTPGSTEAAATDSTHYLQPDPAAIAVVTDSLSATHTAYQPTVATTRQKPLGDAIRFFGLGRFQHAFTYSRDAYVYADASPQSGYYQNIYTDSTTTFDTVCLLKFENEISWTNAGFLHKNVLPIAFRFALKHQYAEHRTPSHKRIFNQLIPNGSINLSLWNRFSLSGYGFLVKGDYNDGDLGLRGAIDLRVGNRHDDGFKGEAGFYSEMPGYFFQYYESNHFRWNNNFDRQETWFAKIRLRYRMASLGADYFLLNQYVYLNKEAIPAQHGAEMSVIRLWAGVNLKPGRWNIDGQAVVQVASDTSVMKLPQLLVRATVFYTGHLFSKALKIQPGIDFYWYPAYHASNYMPALQSFYLQDVKTIGGYPWIDLFANFRVKRAVLFLRYRHLNATFTGYNYLDAPGYPLPDGGINFGVSWNFYD